MPSRVRAYRKALEAFTHLERAGRNHNARDMPVTLFGCCGGYYDIGKVVTYGNDLGDFPKHTGTLLSLARAMGVTDLDKVGHDNMACHNGVPPELLA